MSSRNLQPSFRLLFDDLPSIVDAISDCATIGGLNSANKGAIALALHVYHGDVINRSRAAGLAYKVDGGRSKIFYV